MTRAPAQPRDPQLEVKFRAAYERAKALSAQLAGPSPMQELEELGRRDPVAFEAVLASMSPMDLARVAYSWEAQGRPKQRPTGLPRHRVLAWIAARGLGKSRAAAERVRERIYAGSMSGMLAAPTIEDVERYQIGGKLSDAARRTGAAGVVESSLRVGLLDVFPPHQRPRYDRDKGEVHFHTGAVYYVQSSLVPEARGGNLDTAWVEEASKIGRENRRKLLDNIELALRVRGPLTPELIITCTPTRDPWIKELVADPGCVTILGDTEENAANLDPDTIARWKQRFGSSRLGRQEMGGEILGDEEGVSPFDGTDFPKLRLAARPVLREIGVAIDTAQSSGAKACEVGIVGGGIDARAAVHLRYDRSAVLGAGANGWPSVAWDLAEQLQREHPGVPLRFVLEDNRGGNQPEALLRGEEIRRRLSAGLPGVSVCVIKRVTAKADKCARAESPAVLAEQGQVRFAPDLVELEEQLRNLTPDGTDTDRADAAVHLVNDLAGLSDDKAAALARGAEAGTVSTRAAFVGLAEAQRGMPRPAFQGRRV